MKSILASKKGQVSSLGPAIIALVIAGVFLILGLVILQSVRDTDVITQVHSSTVANNTVTVTEIAGALSANTAPASACSIDYAINTSAVVGEFIDSSNYTVSGCIISYTGVNADGLNNTAWNVSYSYTYGDLAYVDGNLTVSGLGTFADFWEIIVLAIIISVVIGLLLVVFGPTRRR